MNRKALGSIVFSDPQALAELNQITGEFILAETNRRLLEAREAGFSLAAIDAINLLEGELAQRCRYTIAVVAPVEARVRRLMARDMAADFGWAGPAAAYEKVYRAAKEESDGNG